MPSRIPGNHCFLWTSRD